MASIEEQLGIPKVRPGEITYMPELYNVPADQDMAFTTPIVVGTAYSKAEGNWNLNQETSWQNCGGSNSGMPYAYAAVNGWMNVGGQHSCKQECESLFAKGEEKTLRDACKSTCASRCQIRKCNGYWPTRSSVCLQRGLNADCTPKTFASDMGSGLGDTTSGDTSGSKSQNDSANSGSDSSASVGTSSGMSTGAKVGIGLGIAALITVGVIVIRKRMKKGK